MVLCGGSTECDLAGIFGFPARLTGGGAGGVETLCRSEGPPFLASMDTPMVELGARLGFDSSPGVLFRLGILKAFGAWDVAGLCDGESNDVCGLFREGSGERICGSGPFGGDAGDWTVTLGGDLVGDLGGEKATMEVGRDFALLQGVCRLLPRGVVGPVTLRSARFCVEVRAPVSLGISSDMRPFLLLSSTTLSRSAAAEGEGWRGLAGVGFLFALSMFSKWLRREDTGF